MVVFLEHATHLCWGGGGELFYLMNFASCLDMRITCFYEMLDYKNLEYIFFLLSRFVSPKNFWRFFDEKKCLF